MLTTKRKSYKRILLLTALLLAILLLTVGRIYPFSANAGQAQQQNQAEASPLNYSMLSPAQALSNGKPTVFFFYPVDTCRSRYCQQPSQVAGMLKDHFGDQVNFVAVALNAMTYGPDPISSPEYALVNWDVYPVAPYAEWLPEVIHTASENGLPEPRIVLLDSVGKMVYEGHEFFPWAKIETHIVSLLGK